MHGQQNIKKPLLCFKVLRLCSLFLPMGRVLETKMATGNWWNDTSREKIEVLGTEHCDSATLPATNLTWTGPGSNPYWRITAWVTVGPLEVWNSKRFYLKFHFVSHGRCIVVTFVSFGVSIPCRQVKSYWRAERFKYRHLQCLKLLFLDSFPATIRGLRSFQTPAVIWQWIRHNISEGLNSHRQSCVNFIYPTFFVLQRKIIWL